VVANSPIDSIVLVAFGTDQKSAIRARAQAGDREDGASGLTARIDRGFDSVAYFEFTQQRFPLGF
jgi:hypothetical protein